jgi:transcriptional regulator with GAF, ATPase, and Fis domain/tRNA A-37 threonylcarbamoyl transferase component Bud32/tetratricopeptide (TPR) repeat protein
MSVVWRARHRDTGRLVALKIAKEIEGARAVLAREAAVLSRVQRRWGPALVDAGAGFLATEWIDGEPMDARGFAPSEVRAAEVRAAVVAHGVARALEELHHAGVRHGDVKPANVLLAPRPPTRDAAADRGATLIDLGLATETDADARGGTPRYAAPELRARGEGGPQADLWALGVLLAEILDPRVCEALDPRDRLADWGSCGAGGPARWVKALVATAPGGRPDASWLAVRAARWLGLVTDDQEVERARIDRVRRAYLKERARDIVAGATVSPDVGEPARGWLQEGMAWTDKISVDVALANRVEPLAAVRRARWLVSLVGPSAAAWPLGSDGVAEGDLAARLIELARVREPASWTLEDVAGRATVRSTALEWSSVTDDDRTARLVRELGRATPTRGALTVAEDEVAGGKAPPTLILQLASALSRGGETGRAWAAVAMASGPEAAALRAELARKRGDVAEAGDSAARAIASGLDGPGSSGRATLARLAWDEDDVDGAERHLRDAYGAAAAEVRALVAWRRGQFDAGLRGVEQAVAGTVDVDALARLEGVRGMLEMGRGAAAAALHAFGRAVEFATRAGSVLDEATYLTSEAAAAADAGDVARTLASATRAALLWERLGRPERAARAWLARAAALATIGALHATDEAAEEARARGLETGDRRVVAYARWAQVEVRPPGDENARAWAIEAAQLLLGAGNDDGVRAAARRLIWARDTIHASDVMAGDQAVVDVGPAARWDWWGARAHALVADGPAGAGGANVLGALSALVDVPAPLGSRGPALDAAVRLATHAGDGEAARRFGVARSVAVRTLREGTPPHLVSTLAAVAWAQSAGAASTQGDVAFAPAQVVQLEAIVRALSARDRLRPLLEQVLDTLVLWTGVERGLLLLRAPDGRLVPRAARNLARRDITGDQLALSQTIARQAIETGDAVVATDALSTLGDVHASVHALRLRSVLAVPLLARGETLGVVYLDDRVRKGAFGPGELAWVRVVASQAAMAIADARDAVLLRRAARRADRARVQVEALLREREAELDVTRAQLQWVGNGQETRYRYDEISGRSEPMCEMLKLVDRVTASDVPLLIVGESGTGKELVARAVHKNGSRGRRAFVGENCASVPETLLESTLFGHVRGAFTGASSTRAGLFDVADAGTLFLDEIGEMSLAMQAKLLRVLQDGEVRAVGGDRARKVDVRVIAATHRDLSAMVASGDFREDLFYRLHVITIRIPSLRERAEDIPLLVMHFVSKHAPGRQVQVTRAAMKKLVTFPWPGNVRQLENEVRRSLVLSDGTIDVGDLSAEVLLGRTGTVRGAGLGLRSRVDALETELLVEALSRTRGNQTRAAQLLGLSRFGLQKMVKRLGVKMPVSTS